jgi:peptide/nickel transport system permease protein
LTIPFAPVEVPPALPDEVVERRARHRWSPSLVVGAVLVGIVVVLALVSLVWTPFPPGKINAPDRLLGPTWRHPMGTDKFGHDVLSQIMQGARLTLYVGVVAVGVSGLIGIPLGLVAAVRGGWLDETIGRIADVAFAFPAILLAVILAAAYGASTTTAMVAIGIANIPVFARITRNEARRVLATEFVLAARTSGRSRTAITTRHVLPNIAPTLIVQATILFAIAVLAEAALSYLGLGTPRTTPSWGRMLFESKELYGEHFNLALWPGLFIAIAVMGFNLLGDGLRDALDPRLRRTRT